MSADEVVLWIAPAVLTRVEGTVNGMPAALELPPGCVGICYVYGDRALAKGAHAAEPLRIATQSRKP